MMHQTSIDKRIVQFRYIRVLACLFIVLLHTLFASNVYFEDSITSGQLLATETCEHLLMWAVPMFLMVTGALLLQESRRIDLKKLFGKYIRRIALALVCFTLLFQVLDYINGDVDSVFKGWLSNLLQGHSWAHMWYLYLMLGIYLMIPFYRMISARADLKMIWFLIGVIVLFVSLLPLIEFAGFENGFYIPTSIIYPVYVFAGYALYEKNMDPVWAALILIVSTAMIVFLSIVAGEYEIFGYDSIFVVAQSIALYSLLLRLRLPDGGFLRALDDCGFGIYLIHMIGVRLVMKWIGFDPYMHSPFPAFAAMVLMFYIFSFFIAFVIRKIPKLDLL